MWLIYAITASMIWGLVYSLSEKLFQSKISPLALLSIQMLMGGLFYSGLLLRTTWRNDLSILLQNRPLLFVFFAAAIASNLANLLISYSIQSKNATYAGLIELSYPIFTVLFTWLLFKQSHLTASVVFGGSLIALGVIWIGLTN